MQADILATFRKKILQQPSLFSLKHYHRPLVRHACSVGLWSQSKCLCALQMLATSRMPALYCIRIADF